MDVKGATLGDNRELPQLGEYGARTIFLSFIVCMVLGKFLKLSEVQFSQIQSTDNSTSPSDKNL